MNVKVYNQNGEEIGTTELQPGLFEIEPNEAVVHQYIVNLLARRRQGNASTRVRSEVRGGGRKPWRQKGTGRARAGTIRSPLWRGGGIVFGPHPRSYGSNMPRKMKRLAIRSVFADRAQAERIKVLDKVELEQIKTKAVASMMTKLDLDGKKCLVLDEGRNDKLALSCRNLQKVQYCRAALANGYDLLNADVVLITQAGLDKVHEVFG
ncbi:MAG: 50S ribosomal protein L4 [candidate division Zixibacteria bacterium]|nr:50S ribosomal protein L4 [candidate division Zixibacteria bacterium]MDH3937971.1 50S ribosomal protein L4 [candidate division Zixibacteria bacterium]MDH4034240.1 50S ribosomal protein L4 [candidate division Zixibacteria bacterium]